MPAPTYLQRIVGGYQKVAAIIIGGTAAQANAIVATGADGFLDDSVIHPALVVKPVVLPASEAIAAGGEVNFWNNAGTQSMRNADATTNPPRRADGFVNAAVANGANGSAYRRGVNTGLSGLTIGADYYLGAAGAVATAQNTTSGQLDQFIGTATSATTLDQPGFQAPVLNS